MSGLPRAPLFSSVVAMTVIEVTNLMKRYGDRTAVHDVSFSVAEGEIFGIVGRNGVGKTTTVECVSGLRRPDGGTVSVLGLDPQRDRAELCRRLGVQLQDAALQDRITVREALTLFASFYDTPARPDQLMDELGIADQAGTAFAKLSGGQKQRLSIALALVGNPRIAILDELTTGLDPQARRDAWQLIEQIRDRGITILLVTHFMDEAQRLCDRIAVIHDGRVTGLDTPAGLIAQATRGQLLRFRTEAPLDEQSLTALPAVHSVERVVSAERPGAELLVRGDADMLHIVLAELARLQIVPAELRVEQAGLEDAFIALTGDLA
jgi:ABC-2 type transport system ATP-binding protein